jgi:hypothetical protein
MTHFQSDHADEELRRIDAFHEAGHAVAAFLNGNGSRIVHISMLPSNGYEAHIRIAMGHEWRRLRERGSDPTDHRALYRLATREAIYCFAGPAAAHRCRVAKEPHWFDKLVESYEVAMETDGDFDEPLHLARSVCQSEGHAWAFLRRCASWSDELLAVPRVQQTVLALATVLEQFGIVDGGAAFGIMKHVWGRGDVVPIFDLGCKWRRRMT